MEKEKDVPSDHDPSVEGSDTRVMLSTGETNHGFITQEVKTNQQITHSEIKDGFRMWDPKIRDMILMVILYQVVDKDIPSELIPILTKRNTGIIYRS